MKSHCVQLPVAEWCQNTALRSCSADEKVAWIDVLCMLHTSPEYGVLRMPLDHIARAIGCDTALLQGLIRKGILCGRSATSLPGDGLHECSGIPLTYAPRHGRRTGATVTLIGEEEGDLYFCDWMLIAQHRSNAARKVAIASGRMPRASKPLAPAHDAIAAVTIPGGDDTSMPDATSTPASLRCPYERLIDAFAAAFPAARRPRRMGSDSALGKSLQQAWRRQAALGPDEFSGYTSVEEGVAKWQRLFELAARSPFLRGERQSPGRDPFAITLDWLAKPRNLEQVLNGKYLPQEGARSIRASVNESAQRVADLIARSHGRTNPHPSGPERGAGHQELLL